MANELFRFIQARAPGRTVSCPINRYLIRNFPKSHDLLDRLLGNRDDPQSAAATARSFFESAGWQNAEPKLREMHTLAQDLREGRMTKREGFFTTLSIVLGADFVPLTLQHTPDALKTDAWRQFREFVIVAYVAALYRQDPARALLLGFLSLVLYAMAVAECLASVAIDDIPANLVRAGDELLFAVPEHLRPAGSSARSRSPDSPEPVSRPQAVSREELQRLPRVRRSVEALELAVASEERAEAESSQSAMDSPLLPDATKKVLIEFKLQKACLVEAHETLSRERTRLSTAQLQQRSNMQRMLINDRVVMVPPAMPFQQRSAAKPDVLLLERSAARVLGLGDLRIVRNTPVRYELGQIAHIQNVMKSEFLERNHRRLLSEETTDESAESKTTVDETSLESTVRFELEAAMESETSVQAGINAGVQVSGSYGTVNYGAEADASLQTSFQNSQRNASAFAHEVVRRAQRRVEVTVSSSRRSVVKSEIEETNLHRFDNVEGEEHLAGIYRWVNLVQKVELINHGPRLLIECYIPEPAGTFKQLMASGTAQKIDAQPPEPFEIFDNQSLWFRAIEPTDIDADNFAILAAKWNVTGIDPPPPPFVRTGWVFDFQNGGESLGTFDLQLGTISTEKVKPAVGTQSHLFKVPAGYEVRTVHCQITALFPKDMNKQLITRASIAAGDRSLILQDSPLGDISQNSKKLSGTMVFGGNGPNWRNAELPLAVSSHHHHPISVACEIYCQRTFQGYSRWQLNTFEKLRGAYEAERQAYEEQVNAAQVRSQYFGRNPARNRELERRELKRGALEALIPSRLDEYGAIDDTGPYPHVMAANATPPTKWPMRDQVKRVTFFEEVFDWANMTYVFYPYFWGRKSEWAALTASITEDPVHQAFLEAGAARLVIPVKEGCERLALAFFDEGEIWGGEAPPTAMSEEYVTLMDELQYQTKPSEQGELEERWEATLPTSLVALDADATLPFSLLTPPEPPSDSPGD